MTAAENQMREKEKDFVNPIYASAYAFL